MSNNVIEVKEVVKDYANHRALDHVSLEIPEGKIYGLLGPNGAGKTTLIRILNRITAPDSGEIIFDGRPFRSEDLNLIGYLPEERGLYRKMKVGEQAIYLAQLKGMSRKDAKGVLTEWFEKMDIMPWWNKKVQELSKGMAQKVQFICTVIHKPRLMIFDEPFSGFDPINVELLKNEILKLRDQGHTIIFSTHNMQSVEELCENITLINKSKVVLQGDVQLIKQSYKGNAYSFMFEGDVNIPDSTRVRYNITKQEVDKYGRTMLKLENKNNFTAKDIITEWNEIAQMTQFEEIIPSMHEIFLDTVRSTEEEKKEKEVSL